MSTSPVIHALIAKRAELAGAAADLNRRLQQVTEDLAHVDATLKLLDPSVRLAAIRPKRPAPDKSPHFQMGEIARRCREALRDASPDGVTAEDVARAAMRDKGLNLADAKLLADFTQRMSWTLGRLALEGAARKDGKGGSARWAGLVRQ